MQNRVKCLSFIIHWIVNQLPWKLASSRELSYAWFSSYVLQTVCSWGGLGESVLSSAHRVWRWKHLSGSITCIRASFSDQLTTTKCNRKGSFFPSRDVSGVLASNFIFIDHRLFCSISTELAEGHLISSPNYQSGQYVSTREKSNSSSDTAGFSKKNLLWHMCIKAC